MIHLLKLKINYIKNFLKIKKLIIIILIFKTIGENKITKGLPIILMIPLEINIKKNYY